MHQLQDRGFIREILKSELRYTLCVHVDNTDVT